MDDKPTRKSSISITKKELKMQIIELKDKARQIKHSIDILNKECLKKSQYLENSELMLNEINMKIIDINEEIKKMKAKEENLKEVNNDKLTRTMKKRDTQELDKILKEKLNELSRQRLPLIPSVQKSIADLKVNEDELMKVHTVKILFLKGVKDGEILKAEKKNAKELAVRLLNTTKFRDLKDLACEYWELENQDFSLRAFNFALIEYIEEPVEQIIRQQKMIPELWLLESNINCHNSLTVSGDYYTEGNRNKVKRANPSKSREIGQEGRKINYENFRKTFQGMETTMPKQSKIMENFEEVRLDSWELNIVTFLVTLLLFIFTIVIQVNLGDFTNRYFISNQLNKTLESSMSGYNITFDKILTFADIQNFLIGPLQTLYFNDPTNPENPYNNQYIAVGTLKVRFLRTLEQPCPQNVFDIQSPICFYSEYQESTRQTFSATFEEFKTASQNGIDQVIFGEFSDYDGSGFTWDFTTNADDFRSIFNDITIYQNNLRAVIIGFTHYSPNYDYWIFSEILIENSILGSIQATPFYPSVFHANLYANGYKSIIALIIVRAILSLYFLAYYFYFSFKKTKYNTRNLSYLISFRGLLDTLSVSLFFVCLAYACQVKCDENAILNGGVYYDFSSIASYYENAIIINAWSSLLVVFRVITCLSINRRLFMLKLNIEMASRMIGYYLLMMLPLLVAFTFIGWTVWGPYIIFNRRFGLTIIHNILFTVGIGRSFLDMKINMYWTIMFHMLFMFFSTFFITCAIVGIYMEAHRQIRLIHGFKEDIRAWSLIDYPVWLLGCFKKKYIKPKIEDYLKARKQNPQDEFGGELETDKNRGDRDETIYS